MTGKENPTIRIEDMSNSLGRAEKYRIAAVSVFIISIGTLITASKFLLESGEIDAKSIALGIGVLSSFVGMTGSYLKYLDEDAEQDCIRAVAVGTKLEVKDTFIRRFEIPKNWPNI